MIRSVLALAGLLISCSIAAQPPKPAEGLRWVLNEKFSDEFNGSELDLQKWYDYHPGWKGREPAMFLPSQVSVADGYLQLKNRKLDRDTVVQIWEGAATYSIAGGAVVSRTKEAHYGYYECSQKASRIRMSSTFWMTSSTFPGPDPCTEDAYAQELDIHEGVGGADTPATMGARTHMGSNSHFNYTNCEGVKQGYSRGAQIELEKGEISDTFHVYAAHWKNANQADLYLDGKYGANIKFRTDFDDTPFENTMQINMVTETYDWVVPPTAEDLADDSRNTTYIDYVRSWKLVDVDYLEIDDGNLVKNGGFESGNLNYWVGWGSQREVVSDEVYSGNYALHITGPGAPEYQTNLRALSSYTLSCYGKVASGSGAIILGIKDGNEKVLGSVQVTESEWTKKSFTFNTESSGAGLKFYFYAPDAGVEGWGDDFELRKDEAVVEEPVEIPIFDENIRFTEQASALPANLPIEVPVLYQSNGDREIHLQLRDKDSILVSEKVFFAFAGYGNKRLSMAVDPQPPAGEYILVADLRHADSTVADPEKTAAFRLFLKNPIEVKVKVSDVRDNTPLEGVRVQIRDEELLSDAQGLAVFAEVAAGAYALSLEKEGYDELLIEKLDAVNDTLIELSLRPLSYRIKVLVKDAVSAKLISGALVALGDSAAYSKLDGTATFTSYAGDYPLEISAPRYHNYSNTLSLNGEAEFTAELNRALADVKFVVKKENLYLKDALVSIAGQSGTTSSIGIVNFTDLQTGMPHNYSISHEGLSLMEDQLQLRTDSTVRINLGITSNLASELSNGIHLYPNPAGDRLFIEGITPNQSCTILSASGQVLREERIDGNCSLDLKELEAGFYLLQIRDNSAFWYIKQ